MTNGQDSSSDTFEVVLIDIQKAANKEIHCVKKPLTKELKYVAISYRWGELEEFIIDTHVGYSASITSFDIDDFYKLCKAMTKEPTMSAIPYVWVDAVCVNQTNRAERKATIYHMSDIYEHATWILAVPDLHAAHLKAMHQNDMDAIQEHQAYLYHALHNRTDELRKMINEFANEIGVLQDPSLRQSLTYYAHCFDDGIQIPDKLYKLFHDNETIGRLYKESGTSVFIGTGLPDNLDPCDNWVLDYLQKSGRWTRLIMNRDKRIHQAMHFLTDLIVDWSSRVWVISEFHISKKKNNLKFWFNQLHGDNITFFKFDVNDREFTWVKYSESSYHRRPTTWNPEYYPFYERLFKQLNRQTFLEMVLKSKASKHEDRFYAIFPFVPQYKQLLRNKDFDNMNSVIDVKLKLYQVMTNKDKLMLLYLSSEGTPTLTLPTFATSSTDWPEPDDYKQIITNAADVTLLYQKTAGYYLRVRTAKYNLFRDVRLSDDAAIETLNRLLHPKTLHQYDRGTFVDLVQFFVTSLVPVVVVGSLNENTWILKDPDILFYDMPMPSYPPDDPFDFHIY